MAVVKYGSVDRADAVTFNPAGITLDVDVDKNAVQATVNILMLSVDHNTVSWNAGSIAYGDDTSEPISSLGSPHDFNGREYIYKIFGSSTLRFTPTFSVAVGSDRTLLGQIIAGVVGEEATVMLLGDAHGPILAVQNLAVNELSALTANIGHVTAGTITGVLFQTAATGKRIVLSTENTFDFYGVGGAKQFDIDVIPSAFGSDLLITGRITGSGIILAANRGIIVQSNTGSAGRLNLTAGDILAVGDIELDSLTKDGSGSIEINDAIDMNLHNIENLASLYVLNLRAVAGTIQLRDHLNIFSGKDVRFSGNETSDIGTDNNRVANIWANACILDGLALRENQSFAAQNGRAILFVNGSGDLMIRFDNGVLRTIASN